MYLELIKSAALAFNRLGGMNSPTAYPLHVYLSDLIDSYPGCHFEALDHARKFTSIDY